MADRAVPRDMPPGLESLSRGDVAQGHPAGRETAFPAGRATRSLPDMDAYRMTVRFEKLPEQRVARVTAWARDRRPFVISQMACTESLPHDLAGFAAEQALGIADGFFNLIAHGAVFASSGRRRTRPGRAVIVANRQGLLAGEHLVHGAWDDWRAGRPTPAAAALDDVARRWRDLPAGQGFELVWERRPLPVRPSPARHGRSRERVAVRAGRRSR